jgi:hypothetical protein
MPSPDASIKKLQKKADKVDTQLKKLKLDLGQKAKKNDIVSLKNRVSAAEKDIKQIIAWIELQIEWSEEVTMMLRLIDWNALSQAFPGGGGTNPPQTPPNYPPPEED